MTDRQNAHRQEGEPQAPKFMRPRRPVLDAPLEDAPVKPEQAQTILASCGECGASEVDTAQELTPVSETPVDAAPKAVEPPPTSPYFPRGIYEDAQSVEAFYGRLENEELAENSTIEETFEGDGRAWRRSPWWIAALAFVLILALLLGILTKGIPLNLF